MDVISNINDKRRLRVSWFVYCFIWAWMCFGYGDATAQCDLTPEDWITRLTRIENADEPIEHGIKALSTLRSEYESCHPDQDSIQARILHRLGDFHRLKGDFQQGIKLTSKAVAINKRNSPNAEEAFLTHSWYNLGLFHTLLGLSRNAQLYFDSCVATGIKFPKKMFIALMALEKKSYLQFQAGDYEQSIRTAAYGINLARDQSLPDYEGLLLIQRAQAESELHQVALAERTINEAISLLEKYELEVYLPNAWSVYAHILGRKKSFGEAVNFYRRAYEVNLVNGNGIQSARDLNDLALLYDRGMNDAEHAIAYYQKAVDLLTKFDDPWLLATTYNNLGLVAWRRGDHNSALEYYQKGLIALPIGFDNPNSIDNPLTSQLQSASNAYVPAALLWNKGDAWLGLYESTKDSKMLEHALEVYRRGDRMVDQMRWKQQGKESKLFWREKTKQWYTRAVEASFLLNDPAEAFSFMEKARAVLLNDRLAELGAKSQLPPKEAENEKQLRIRLQSIEASALDAPSRDSRLWNARQELNAFIRRLEKLYPSYYAYKYDTAVVSLQDLQTRLNGVDHTWLELFAADSIVYALTATVDTTRLFRLSFPEHSRLAGEINDLCSESAVINRSFKRYQMLGFTYYKELFEPLKIPPGRVTVSQDEYFLPFELLHRDSLNPKSYLLQDYAFSYAYSASHFLKHSGNDGLAKGSLLGIAPVLYDPRLKLQELTGADQSLDRIGSHYDDGVYLTKGSATRDAFLKQLPTFDVIHVYSHASADTLGQEPVIYFYDSALHLSDLQNLPDLKPRLVVLFACNTGVGRAVRGEGTLSLARGFASAGIPSTISALWEIDNRTTYALAEVFFRHLSEGQPSDIALQRAKLDIINNHDRAYELPYFWAGTVLIGRPEVFARHSPFLFPAQSVYFLLAAIMLILAGLGFIVRRRRAG